MMSYKITIAALKAPRLNFADYFPTNVGLKFRYRTSYCKRIDLLEVAFFSGNGNYSKFMDILVMTAS